MIILSAVKKKHLTIYEYEAEDNSLLQDLSLNVFLFLKAIEEAISPLVVPSRQRGYDAVAEITNYVTFSLHLSPKSNESIEFDANIWSERSNIEVLLNSFFPFFSLRKSIIVYN